MQNDRTCRPVLGVGILFLLHLQALSAGTIEDLLQSQNTHEDSAHSDLTSWARGAQKKLTDRISFQKERINELTGAIGSYSDKVEQLRSSPRKAGAKPLDSLRQEQRVQLIQKESEHWRSVHARDAAQRLLKADEELLAGVQSALKWEDQATSQHREVRQHLIALVQEHNLDKPVEQQPPSQPQLPAAVAALAPAPPAATVQQAITESLMMPAAPLRKADPVLPKAFPQAQTARRTEVVKPHTAMIPFLAESEEILGISKLPALQLMQAEVHPSSSQASTGLLQEASHPLPPMPPAAAAAEQPATAFLTPMLTLPPTKALSSVNPLLSLAGMSTGTTAQVLEPAPAAPVAATAPVAPKVTSPPAASPTKPASLLSQLANLPSLPAAPTLEAQDVSATPPAVLPAAPVAPPPATVKSEPAVAPKALADKAAQVAPSMAAMIEQALPLFGQPKKSALLQTPPKKTINTGPDDALMAIMNSGVAGPAPDSLDVEAALAPPPMKRKSAPRVLTAFLATKVTPKKVAPKAATAPVAKKPLPKAPAPVATEEPDSDDALMNVMVQSGIAPKAAAPIAAPVKVPAAQPKAVKHAPRVLTQTSDAGTKTTLKVRAASKQEPQPAPDSEAGVMKSFVQEVSDLGQGEPGSSDPAAEKEEEEPQESEANVMSSFVQEVSQLAQGEATEVKPTFAPNSASGKALSSDLASLMGLSAESPIKEPASFLQVGSQGRRSRAMSRSELAAASLIKDLDGSEVSKRLARTVSQSTAQANVQMLTALKEQLEARQLHWKCAKGSAAAHSSAILQLAETGTGLLIAERDTVASLKAELRDSQAESGLMKAEFVALMEQTLGRSYDAESADLASLPLAQIRSETALGASAIVAFENSLHADAVAARQLGAKWVDTGADYVRLGDELLQQSSAKDSELTKAKKVLSDARTRAAKARQAVAKEAGCSDAVRTSGLIAAVYKSLHILSD